MTRTPIKGGEDTEEATKLHNRTTNNQQQREARKDGKTEGGQTKVRSEDRSSLVLVKKRSSRVCSRQPDSLQWLRRPTRQEHLSMHFLGSVAMCHFHVLRLDIRASLLLYRIICAVNFRLPFVDVFACPFVHERLPGQR